MEANRSINIKLCYILEDVLKDAGKVITKCFPNIVISLGPKYTSLCNSKTSSGYTSKTHGQLFLLYTVTQSRYCLLDSGLRIHFLFTTVPSTVCSLQKLPSATWCKLPSTTSIAACLWYSVLVAYSVTSFIKQHIVRSSKMFNCNTKTIDFSDEYFRK